MFRVVFLQFLATVIVTLLAGALGDRHAAMSALLGGAACFVPNGLFALKLAASARRPQGTGPAVFLAGEFVKVASTVALLALVAATYPKLNWLAMIVALIVVLKSYILALLFEKR
jgi:ATP synthase protein I